MASVIYEYTVNTRFTQGVLQLLFTFFGWKTSKWAYNFQFFISCWKKSLKLHVYYTILLTYCFALSTISVFLKSLNNHFLYGLFASPFSVNKLYYVAFKSFFSASSCFPRFSWSRFFWVQVQCPGLGFKSSPWFLCKQRTFNLQRLGALFKGATKS